MKHRNLPNKLLRYFFIPFIGTTTFILIQNDSWTKAYLDSNGIMLLIHCLILFLILYICNIIFIKQCFHFMYTRSIISQFILPLVGVISFIILQSRAFKQLYSYIVNDEYKVIRTLLFIQALIFFTILYIINQIIIRHYSFF